MKEQNQTLPLDITPEAYLKLNSKQLGNHFIYAKLSENEKWNDPRLGVLQPHYFIGKNVLDVGCNEGILSIPIAIKFRPKTVAAVDIDSHMVKKTKANIQKFIDKNEHFQLPKQIVEDIKQLPLLLKERLANKFGDTVYEIDKNIQFRPKGISPDSLFPQNIEPKLQNILNPTQLHTYDCILCMNVTKWIHLAHGDEGIRALFNSLHKMSTEGTVLILESQPWQSYRKKKNMYASYKQNYRMILHKPQRFKDYLKKLGFDLIETITPTPQNLIKHEILVFRYTDKN